MIVCVRVTCPVPLGQLYALSSRRDDSELAEVPAFVLAGLQSFRNHLKQLLSGLHVLQLKELPNTGQVKNGCHSCHSCGGYGTGS